MKRNLFSVLAAPLAVSTEHFQQLSLLSPRARTPFRAGRHSSEGEVNPAGTKISRLASRGMLTVRSSGLQVHRDSQGRMKLVSRR